MKSIIKHAKQAFVLNCKLNISLRKTFLGFRQIRFCKIHSKQFSKLPDLPSKKSQNVKGEYKLRLEKRSCLIGAKILMGCQLLAMLLCLSCLPHPVSAVTLVDFYGPEQMYSSAFFFGYLKSETYIPICMPFHILMGGKMDWPSLRYWEQSLLFH